MAVSSCGGRLFCVFKHAEAVDDSDESTSIFIRFIDVIEQWLNGLMSDAEDEDEDEDDKFPCWPITASPKLSASIVFTVNV